MSKPKHPTVTALQVVAEEAYVKNGASKVDKIARRMYLNDSRIMRLAIRSIVNAVRAEMIKGAKP